MSDHFTMGSPSGRFGSWNTDFELPQPQRQPGEKTTVFVYRELKHSIVSLHVPPLAILTETGVAERYGVSRTPVREAFLRLESDSLLEVLPRRGGLVPPITLREIEEQAQVRLLIEREGLRQVDHTNEPYIEALEETIKIQSDLLKKHPEHLYDLVRIDKEFHWLLVKAAGNTELSRLYTSLHDRQMRVGVAMFKKIPHRKQCALDQHHDIFNAISEGKLDDAAVHLENHLISSLDQVRNVFHH